MPDAEQGKNGKAHGKRDGAKRRHVLNPQSLWNSLRARPRLIVAAVVALAVLLLLPGAMSGSVRTAMAWIVGAVIYVAGAFHTMATSDHKSIARRAEAEDESRTVILVLLLLAIAANVVSIVGVMSEAKLASGVTRGALAALAGSTLVVSWTLMQVVFSLHYAHEYYRPDDATGQRAHGLEFPGEDQPDYWDFFYFSTSIGAASQTSDTSIKSSTMRRLVTAHAIVAFFYNFAVLALAINLAASLI